MLGLGLGSGVHFEAPADACFPGTHWTQPPLPWSGWCCPGEQSVQVVAPVAAYRPGGQAVQSDMPLCVETLPTAQARQLAFPLPEYAMLFGTDACFPAAQSAHTVLPDVGASFPPGHSRQVDLEASG